MAKKMIAMLAVALAAAWTGLADTVANVRWTQRANSCLVDIYYDLDSPEGGSYLVKVAVEGRRTDDVVASSFSGDVGDGVTPGKNRHILWDAGADWPNKKGDVTVKVVAKKSGQSAQGQYMVVDLSEGQFASRYHVTYMNDLPSGDIYKTSKLVLRKIPAGSFTMGCPESELGYGGSDKKCEEAVPHSVTISEPFYLGVFEVTQKQYELVTGSRPSFFSNASCYETRPVETVSWNNASNFISRLREKTCIGGFNLPTEAQWEYACRAGTTTALNSGSNLSDKKQDSSMGEVGRYKYNYPSGGTTYSSSSDTSAGTAEVGSYKPNAWGLYDMHGNVWEWCLDWFTSGSNLVSAATDPVGPASGSERVYRGGSWQDEAQNCRSAYRKSYAPNGRMSYRGFRLYCASSGYDSSESGSTGGSGNTGGGGNSEGDGDPDDIDDPTCWDGTGVSDSGPVDTTDGTGSGTDSGNGKLRISNVKSRYFEGAYGGATGSKATFLNGTSCKIEMTVLMDDYSVVSYWLVNGKKVTARTFEIDVGTIAVGDKIEVVAVGKNGERSNTFRANFDIATHVEVLSAYRAFWVARSSNSGGTDEIVYERGVYPSASFPLADEKKGTKPDKLKWLPGDEWALAPKIDLKPEVRSSGNGSFTLGTVGLGLGTSDSNGEDNHKNASKGTGKLARVMDADVGISFTGGPLTLSWNPQKRMWVPADISFGAEVSGSLGLTHYYPTPVGPLFLEVKGELALGGSFKVSGFDSGWSGLESSFTISSDRLPKVSVAGGYGVNNVLCVKGVLSGMSVLEATHSKGTWTDTRWGVRGSGALTAKAFIFDATLFEVTSQTFWFINSSTSPKSMPASGVPLSDLEWRLQPRDYLTDVTGSVMSKAAISKGGTVVETGGYPDPQPAMASGKAGDALAYIRDNTSRSSANRTELVLRTGTGNAWGAAEVVWNDGTADFMPSLAAMADGSVVAAWMNASRTFSDSVTIDEFCGAAEIAVGIRNASTGKWTCRNLTSNSAFDFSPIVRAAANGKVLVAWLRNTSGKLTSSSSAPTDIMAAVYANGSWGAATVVRSGVGLIHGFDVAFDGDRAVLAFSKDSDGNASTVNDSEIHAIRFANNSWASPIRLTAAGDADGMPVVRTTGDGTFAILWTAKGVLMETVQLSLSKAVAVAAADGWTLPVKPVLIRGTAGRDALVWNGVSATGCEADAPTAMMYDPVFKAWGSPVKLFDDGRKESRLSGAVGIDGGIRLGYGSSYVSVNASGEASLGATALRAKLIPAVCDLAVDGNSFSFSTNKFTIGDSVFVDVKVSNLGFRPATNATVKVYVEFGGLKVMLAKVVKNIPGGGTVVIRVPWIVDNMQTNLRFKVEVDPGANTEASGANGNNTFTWSEEAPDVSFGTVSVMNENATRRLLSANVVNNGLGPLPAGGKVVFRRGGVDGAVLGMDTVGKVWPGAGGAYSAGFTWDMGGGTFNSDWETVCVQLFTNGTATKAVDTAFIQVMTPLKPILTIENGVLKKVNLNGCTEVTIPDSVTSIAAGAFSDCGNLRSLSLPGNLRGKLASSVFNGCPADMQITYRIQPTITFNANGGKFSNGAATKGVTATPGNLWGKMPMPSLSGYVFDGWYTALNGGDIVTASSAVPNAATTYYAHWTKRLGLAAASEWNGVFTTDTWCGQGTVAYDRYDALRSGIIYDGQSSYLITRVTGSGILTFWWAVSCEGGGKDALRFLVDGQQKELISGEVGWTKVEIHIRDAGTHVLKWNYTKNGSVTKGEDFGWVDKIAWQSVPSTDAFVFDANGGKFSNGASTKKTDAEEGLLWGKLPMPSLSGYVFKGWYTAKNGGNLITSSDKVPFFYAQYYANWTPRLGLAAASDWSGSFETDNWCGQGAVTHDGKDALRSGIIYDGQSSYILTRVTGAGTLTFWWRVSSEGGGKDALRFLVDGVQKGSIAGETAWTKVTLNITGSGTHVLKWLYSKNASVTKGQDFGWVDQISWTAK